MVRWIFQYLVLLLTTVSAACGARSNLLETAAYHSSMLHKSMGFSVLRAPPKAGVDAAALPVVLFLHGMGSNHLAFDKFGVSDAIHTAMQRGEIPMAHFVFPNGERGFYLNWYDGSHPYEDYILEEVLPRAERLLGLRTVSSRHIAGVSMGGIGALQIGLRNTDKFASVSCISGVVLNRKEANAMMDKLLIRLFAPVKRIWGDGTDDAFSDSINPYQLARHMKTVPRLFLAAGTRERDQIRNTTARFHRYLAGLGAPHAYVVFDGEHTWADWVSVIKKAVVYALK